ncbi:ABC transporter permease [Thermodesulfobacteriota bacterium]
MYNYRILAVIKRELREKLMSKAFIFMTLLMPVIMFGIMGLQALIALYEGDKGTKVEIVTESQELTGKFEKAFSNLEFVKDKSWTLTYNTVSGKKLESYVETRKKELLSDKLTGIIFVPQTAFEDKKLDYYAKTPNKLTIYEKMNGPINNVLIEQYFSERVLTDKELNFARMSVGFNNFKVSKEKEIEPQGAGNMILAFVFAFLLYMGLIMSGTMTMTSVLEEKTSKVVEVLLSSVSSRELMTGKILGASITTLVQMIIWLLPLFVLVTTSWITLPESVKIDISFGYLAYFFINFFLGVMIFQGLFAAVGAIFNEAQETQSGAFPVILLILIPFIISFTMIRNPDNPIAVIASYVPFSTVLVMPCRYTLVDMSVIYPILSCLINAATLVLVFYITGKIYRVGILRTGTKPTWREVFRWVTAKE